MTSQRWTRIRPPISPLPPPPPLPFSPGSQQTGCQVALPALPKVLPLIPLPSSTPLHSPLSHTHTQCSLIHSNYTSPIIPSILLSLAWFVSGLFTNLSDPKKSNSILSPPSVLLLCFFPRSPLATLCFSLLLQMTKLEQVKGDIYSQDRAQMKCPIPLAACSGLVLFHRNYKLSPPPAGTITPLAP